MKLVGFPILEKVSKQKKNSAQRYPPQFLYGLYYGKWSINILDVILGIAKNLSLYRNAPKLFCTLGSSL
jgi:hypothetical protein